MAAVTDAKRRCGLSDIGHRLIAQLSKGYRQRVGIAQAIVHDPRVLILDEPTTGLDPNQIREIRELIAELGKDKAIILSTHILPEVQSLCTRVLILHLGRLVYSGTPETDATGAAGDSLHLVLDRPPDPAILSALPSVRSAEPLGSSQFRVHLETGASPESLIETMVRNGWGLRACTPVQSSLEKVFFDLTTREDAA